MKSTVLTILLTLCLTVGVFLIDFALPVQVATGVGYVVVIGLSYRVRWAAYPVLLAAFCSALVLFRPLAVQNASDVLKQRDILADRFFCLFAIWITTVLTTRVQRLLHVFESSRNIGSGEFASELVGNSLQEPTQTAQSPSVLTRTTTRDEHSDPAFAAATSSLSPDSSSRNEIATQTSASNVASTVPGSRKPDPSPRRDWDWFAVFDGISAAAVCVTRPDGRLVRANAQWCEWFGQSSQDIASGRVHWQQMATSASQRSLEQQLLQLAENGTTPPTRQTLRTSTDQSPAAVQIVELATAQLPVAGQLWIMIDLSREQQLSIDRDENQAAAEQHQKRYHQLLQTVTRDIRPQLEQMLTCVEDSGAWAYGLPGEPGAMELAATTQELLLRLDDLTELSHSPRKRQVATQPVEFRLSDCLEQTATHLQQLQPNCDLMIDVDDRLPGNINADRRRWQQILRSATEHLIENRMPVCLLLETALPSRSRPASHREPREFSTAATSGRQLELRITAELTADGFTTRSRVSATRFEDTLAGQIVSALGGVIVEEIHESAAARMTVRLPFASAKSVDEAPDYRVPELVGVPILLVDHHSGRRRILEQQFKRWNLVPTTVENAYTALETLRQAKHAGRRYPLVVAPLQLPGVSGLALADRLQRDPELADQLILLKSQGADATQSTGEQTLVEHPWKRDELFAAITRALGVSADIVGPHSETHASLEFPSRGHIDWASAYRQAEESRETLRERIEQFLTAAPEALQEMRTAIAAGQSTAVEAAADLLQRVASPLACAAFLQTCSRIRQNARKDHLGECPALWDSLRRELAVLVDELNDFLLLAVPS